MNSTSAFRISACFGFAAVALGAFGAHSLKPLLLENQTLPAWESAAHYHLIHSVVLLLIATREPLWKRTWLLFAAGIVIFSGSLYTLALTNVKWLGAITPLGGLAFLVGWLAMALRKRN